MSKKSPTHEKDALILLSALAKISALIGREATPKVILATTLDHAVRALKCVGGIAYLPSPDGRYLLATHALNRSRLQTMDVVIKASQKLNTQSAPDVAGKAAASGKAIWTEHYGSNDVAIFPRAALVQRSAIGTVVAVPIVIYGKVAAVLEFFFKHSRPKEKSTLDFIVTLSHTAGLGILRCYMKETLVLQQDKSKRNMEEKIQAVLEAKRRAESASQSKMEFLANVSHELRTPMHAILSYSDLGIKRNDPEKLKKYFTSIKESGSRLLHLLNDLLDLSKLEYHSMKMDFVMEDICEIAQGISTEVWPLLKDKKLTLEVMEDPHVNTIAAVDKFRIQQVLLNLLSNAIRYSHEKSTIYIAFEASSWEDGDVTIPGVKVLVVDEGVGIPPGEEESVFDKFSQSSTTKTGAGGTGLGLAICREIIQAHNGTIYAENNMAVGATFAFTLPLKQTNTSRKKQK